MFSTFRHFLFVLFFVVIQNVVAQENYIDYNPQYNAWTEHYQLDKIEYTSDNTIFYLRFIKENSASISVSFQPSQQEYAWVLQSNDGTLYNFTKLSNVTKNEKVVITELGLEAQAVPAFTKDKKDKTVFTCQLYFPRLPDNLDTISLIEGKNYREIRTHLNFLDIQLKNKNRGSEATEKERIATFETPKDVIKSELNLNSNRFPYIDNVGDYRKTAFIDEKPSYKKNDINYIIDKIVYTESEIIFCTRFVFDGNSTITIHPVHGKYPWVLIDKKNRTTYPLKRITNFCKNGILIYEQIDSFVEINTPLNQTTIFSCRVHFEKTPKNVKKLDLIEGIGMEKHKRHFNYFNIKIKN